MRRYLIGFFLLVAGFGLWLAFHPRGQPEQARTLRFSAFRSLPGEQTIQSVSEEDQRSLAADRLIQDAFGETEKPALLVSWACASTHRKTRPDLMYVRGIVKNASSRQLFDVAAEATFMGPGGVPLATGSEPLYHPQLAPEGVSTFFAFWASENQTPTCSVDFTDRDGPLRSVRASDLINDGTHLFVGRWVAANGEISMNLFRNGTGFLMTDRGVALGAGHYKVIDGTGVQLELSMPPKGVVAGYLYPYDRWRVFSGKTVWRYLPSKDALLLGMMDQPIVLARGNMGSIRQLVSATSETMVLEAQIRLKAEGFDPGPLDGVLGPSTRAALSAFQRNRKLKQTQELDEDTLWALDIGRPEHDLQRYSGDQEKP